MDALAIDNQHVALELHRLIKQLDPARFREELSGAVRREFAVLEAKLVHVLARWPENRDRGLREIYKKILDSVRDARAIETPQWAEFRARLQARYEELAQRLASARVRVPALRPTNYGRNFFHAAGAVFTAALVMFLLNANGMRIVAVSCALTAWTLEATRRIWPGWNQTLMGLFGRFAHPHEHRRINSATWFVTALLFLAIIGSQSIAAIAVLILGLADPAAAIVGRRFGTIKLFQGKSLQGTLAFFVVAGLITFSFATWAHPGVSLQARVLVSALVAVAGSFAELLAGKLDDNLQIPLVVGAVLALFGVAAW